MADDRVQVSYEDIISTMQGNLDEMIWCYESTEWTDDSMALDVKQKIDNAALLLMKIKDLSQRVEALERKVI